MSSVLEVLKDDAVVLGVHFRAMLKKNWLVSKRSYKTTIGQLLAPILFLILLFGLNKLPSDEELNPQSEPLLSTLTRCDPSLAVLDSCISLLYTWNGTDASYLAQFDADSIMDLVSDSWTLPISDYDNSSTSWDSATIYRFDSREGMDTFIIDNPNVTQAAIVFSPSEYAGASVGPQYTILYNDTTTVIDYDLLERIQATVDQAILTYMGRAMGKIPSTQSSTLTISTRKFPVTNQQSFDAVSNFGSLFFYCALMFNFSIFLYQIVNEKQLNLRLGMRMVGLSDIAYWMSWEVTNFILMFIYSILIIIMGYILGLAFFLRTHFLVLLFSFFLFGIAMTQLALLLGMFITTTRQAINVSMLIFVVGVVAQIIFSIQYVFLLLYDPSQASPAYRIILQFYPPFNLSKIISDIGTKSNTDAASQLKDHSLLYHWSDLYEARDYGTYSVPGAYESLLYLIMDIAIFSVLSWYFYNVGSSEKGNHPLFFLTREYWRSFLPKKQYNTPTVEPDSTADSDVQEETKTARDDTSAELRVLGLHKKYSKWFGCKSTIYAVRGVSLSIRKGQVFTLLGHNGAGKTTTLSMLTGIIKPSSGDALVYGKSLRHELPEIQGMLGVCPQHDILWAELTAREHLEIFSEIKRIPKENRDEEIEARLRDVLLFDVRNKQAGKYSGGMKRRLSVAISAIGAPQIIFLDEPTTGLDPGSRREIWNAIQKLKKDRIIILTTHSMEEADFLGDRIGIMARGKLKCIGSSLHLKNKFGLGYRLTVTAIAEKQEEFKQHFKRLVPRAELVAETIGGNLIYGVQTADLNLLVPFFQMVEGDNELGVKDWGISQTTLEEVFLKVTHESEGTEVTIISS